MPDADAALFFPDRLALAFTGLAVTSDGTRVILQTPPRPLTLTPGTITFVTGPSGAGKSRLLRALATLDSVAAGALKLGPHPPDALPGGPPAWRARVAYVAAARPRTRGSPTDLLIAARAFGSHRTRGARAPPLPSLADALLLDRAYLTAPWDTLSSGQAARAVLAVALALGPSVLLLDEPTAALDAASAAAAEKLITAAAAAGVAVLWVSHDPAQPGRVGGPVWRVVPGEDGQPTTLEEGGDSAA